MKNTISTDNALLHKPGSEPNEESIKNDSKVVNEQEQQQDTNDDDKQEDKDKQYDEINKDRSWKGGKEDGEEIVPERTHEEQTIRTT